MEVIFGVPARDGAIRLQLPDDQIAELKKQIEEAFSGDDPKVLWVTDKDGREFGIPSDKLAFVEFGTEKSNKRVGFSSAD